MIHLAAGCPAVNWNVCFMKLPGQLRRKNGKAKVLVTLVDGNGQERVLRVEDDWLYEYGIDEGDPWPR